MTPTAAEPTRSPLPVVPPPSGPAIDYELLLDCVHCGLCTAHCPTYLETGHEADSPRGRIHLMRSIIDGRTPLDDTARSHLDLCLDCRACETACPSGVQYGRLIEPFRLHMAKTDPERQPTEALPWVQKFALMHLFPSSARTKLALAPARLLQRTGIDRLMQKTGLLNLLPASLRQMHGMLPELKPHYGRLPEVLPAKGKQRARVALFLGCVADGLFPQTNLNTARVLQENGCEVWIPPTQQCCGALHYHAAMAAEAEQLAKANCEAFGIGVVPPPGTIDAIITNAAGCGAMLKDYHHLLHGRDASRGEQFVRKVKDISEFLIELGPVKPVHPLNLKATYHDACHLCHAQQIRKPPRQLLGMIPGLELVPLVESEICCGAAGSYNLTQPEMAERLGDRKVGHIAATGAKAVFTGNVGCILQISRHLKKAGSDLPVLHPVDALWASYSGEKLG